MTDSLASDPATIRMLAATSVVLAYALFCGAIFGARAWRHSVEGARRNALFGGTDTAGPGVLVVYASQTGFAEQLAWQTAAALRQGHTAVDLADIRDLTADRLASAHRALFLVSTTGEGDAPDGALAFMRRIMPLAPDLAELNFGMLSLGDRSYAQFCRFGRTVDAWLEARGAKRLFPTVEVSDGDRESLAAWQAHMGELSGVHHQDSWDEPAFQTWRLDSRVCLNPGSAGAGAYHLILSPRGGAADWTPGDIAEIEIPSANGGVSRDYSIASIASDGVIELLIRRMAGPDGALGIGSAWLTRDAAPGGAINLRIRANRAFHPPADDRPMILIGNGTGIAGLRGHLKHRASLRQRRNWLLFGERNARHDLFFARDIGKWRATGVLERADLVFSRDQGRRLYVQDALRAEAARLAEWVGRGAAIYVCGSLEGMSAGVEQVLIEVLGAETVETLRSDGRYRRDVY